MRSCWTVWHKAYPQIPPGNLNFYIEEQGPVQGWCQEIRLFAAAAKAAGRNLNRRTFVEALSKITNFPGGLLARPELRTGQVLRADQVPGGRAPHQLAADEPVQDAQGNIPPQSVCWIVKQQWQKLPQT